MKLLHVHSGNLYGGVETLLLTLARSTGFAPLEHEFALCFNGPVAAQLRAQGALIHLLGEVQMSRPLTALRARRRLQNLLQRRCFDAVVCHMAWTQAIFGGVVRVTGAPLVFWQHDALSGRHWSEKWARRILPDL